MALSYIQMPVDGAGKQVQAWVNALGPGNLYTEAVTITDSTGIEKATASNPLRVDPTGTTVQPVLDAATSATGSGVPSDASYQGLNVSGTLRGITGVNPTGSVYAAQMDLSSVGGTSLALGQAVAASSIPVVLPSGTNVPIVGTLTTNNAAPTGNNIGVLPAVANAAGPSLTEGRQALLSVNLSSQLRVTQGTVGAVGDAVSNSNAIVFNSSVGATGLITWGWNFNGTTWDRVTNAGIGNNVASTGIQTAAAYGQYNTSLPTISTGNYTALQTDSSGRLIVNVGAGSTGNAAASATGSAPPADADYIGANDGTNLRGLTTNSTATSGKYGLDVNVLSILGTAPTTAGFIDIKGADGNVFVRQATAANLNATVVGTGTFAVQEATLDAALIAQEATTSGVKGITAFGAVTTSAPSYTTAKSDALSLDTSGNLRVTNTTAIPAGTNVIGHVIVDSGTITTVSTVTAVTSITNAVTVEGNVAAGSAVSGANDPVLVAGQDGTNVRTLLSSSTGQLHVVADTGSTTAVTQATAANLNATVVPGGSAIFEVSPTTAANTAGNPFFNEITDGTNTMGAMANFGTSPTGVKALNANASLFIGTTVASAAASGVQLVGIEGHAGGVFDAATGAAVPANAIMVGGTDGTDLRAFSVNSSGQQVVVGAGTAGSGSGGVLSIQGVASGVTVPITGTITAVTTITNPVTVVGDAASGSAVAGNPVLVAGQDGTDVRTLLSSSTGQLHVIVDSGGGGGTQYTDGTAESAGAFTITVAGSYNGTDVVGLRSDASDNLYVNLHTALPAGTNVIGHVIADSGSTTAVTGNVTVVQTTAANLNATVVGTGTFAVQEATLDAALIAQEATTSGVKGITVFGAVTTSAPTYTTAKSDALSLDTSGNLRVTNTTAIPAGTNVIGHVIVDSGTITTVTAVTAITNALPAGSNTIGKVDILGNAGVVLDAVLGATKPANVLQVGGNDGTNAYAVPLASGGGSVVVSGSVTIAANSSVNLAQVNGVTTLTGAGASGTGAQRVTVSQDTTTIAGSAPGTAGSASANVISVQGVASMTPIEVSPTTAANTLSNQFFTQLSDGTHGQTFMSSTTSSKYGADTNILSILGTAPTTAGFIDIKGADGNVFVRQATASNLNATVVGSGSAGTAAAGVVTVQGIASMTPVQTTIVPATSGGLSVYHVVSAGSTNAANIKASAGQVYGVSIYNATTYPVYAKLYNTAGTPTAGTGVIQTFGCQAGTETNIPIGAGIPYATGIGITITKGIADSDGTAILANDCVVEVYYK